MQVQALRAVEPHLGLEALYVLGTNCVDNGPREGLGKFLNAASKTPGVTGSARNGPVGAGGKGLGV
jgi:coenzyme F420-reducing hydrogenase beta subunit